MSFLGGDGKAILTREIAAFEAKTSAELVIVVEPRVGHYLHIPLLFGGLAAFAALAFLLYGEPSFAFHWFLVDPLLVALIVGYISSGWSLLERGLTSASKRERWVLRAARAAFVARGVADTRGRTGILLHIAVAERRATLLADLGVRRAIPETAWSQACRPLHAALLAGHDATSLLPHIAALGSLCGEHLPRQDDDENELPDGVDT